jgi:alpha-L-fucosidase 2
MIESRPAADSAILFLEVAMPRPNRGFRCFVCLAVVLCLILLISPPAQSKARTAADRPVPSMGIPDMASYLAQHDLVYERAPERWLDGIPLANGQIGAMVWGTGAPWKITLDSYAAWETREVGVDPEKYNYRWLRRAVAENREQEVWETMFPGSVDRPPGARRPPKVTRLPMPRVEIQFRGSDRPESFDSFRARLRLHEGIAEGEFQITGRKVPWRAWTQNGAPLLVIQFDGVPADGAPAVKATLEHLDEGAKKLLSDWAYPPAKTKGAGPDKVLLQSFPQGGSYAVAWHPESNSRGLTLWVALVVSEAGDSDKKALDIIRRSRALGVGRLRKEHEAWWADFWKASALSIPDSRLENLYYAEMYKLASSTRPDGWPITLQGLWTLDGRMPPWSGDYHLDMNVQESVWPIYASNHLDLGLSLYDFFLECLPRFQKNCREFFGLDGAWSGCALGPKGARVHGYPPTEFWPGNGAWLAHQYWMHWRYSMDRDFLRDKAVPIMKPFLRTYMNLLEGGEDGKLHIPLSSSPEYHEGSIKAWTSDPNCDLFLIRSLALSLLEADEILKLNDPEAARWRETLDRLVDYHADENGLKISREMSLDFSHRHHSHLMGIYPLGLMSPEDGEEARDLVRRSFEHWRRTGYMMWTGWAFPWASCIASRAGYPNMSWAMLDMYANGFITPATLHVNGDYRQFGYSQWTYEPMTLEAGFASAAALMEMLLQSHRGLIRVFPALPDAWKDASFVGLRAEGAFLVSAVMRKGEVVKVEVFSEAGGLCRVKNPFSGPAILTSDFASKAREISGDILSFAAEKGGRYTLARPGREMDEGRGFLYFERPQIESNWFGLKIHPRW